MKYKYIGTEEQLVEHGYKIDGYNKKSYAYWACKDEGSYNSIYIPLNDNCYNKNHSITFNRTPRNKSGEDITPYIQDLIDDGLVEVVE